MKFNSLTFIIVLTFSILMSCKKAEIQNFSPTQQDSIYLSRIIDFDTTKPLGQDTIRQTFIEYDTQKRIKKITQFAYYQTFSETHIFEFEYNGNDTNATKRIFTFTGSGTEIYKTYFYYDNQHKLSASVDSGGIYPIYPSYSVKKYFYSNNFTSQKNYLITRTPFSVDSSQIINTGYSKLNGNIVLQVDSFYINNTYNNAFNKGIATYDNKPNPLFKFAESPLLEFPRIAAGGHFYNGENDFQPNNIIDLVIITPSSTMHITFQYEYNSLGLPVLCKTYSNPAPMYGTAYSKRKYYYTNL